MGYNSNSNSHTTTAAGGGGITITGLLQVAFIILKLCHVIDWSWFWVLFPSILGLGLIILAWIILGVILLIGHIEDKKADKRMAKKNEERAQKLKETHERLAADLKQKEEEERLRKMEEGITYTISYDDLKNPNFPKLNEWLWSQKFQYQLKQRFEIRSAILVGGDVSVTRFRVNVLFYNQKFEEQEKQAQLGIGDTIRIFPCEEKVNILQIETPSRFALGPGLYEEKNICTLTFEKTDDSSPKIK